MKARTIGAKYANDPTRYGPTFHVVAALPCIFRMLDSEHVCMFGHTAHHIVTVGSGGTDADGLLPCCGAAHTLLHSQPLRVWSERFDVDLQFVARVFVGAVASADLDAALRPGPGSSSTSPLRSLLAGRGASTGRAVHVPGAYDLAH